MGGEVAFCGFFTSALRCVGATLAAFIPFFLFRFCGRGIHINSLGVLFRGRERGAFLGWCAFIFDVLSGGVLTPASLFILWWVGVERERLCRITGWHG